MAAIRGLKVIRGAALAPALVRADGDAVSRAAAADEGGMPVMTVEFSRFDRQYTGLDDKALDLLEKVDVASLGEANLDFASV
ncbi:hypothetical protein [Streptomyces sp. NPDC051662]|uniref:hypothetical protein n=1 Tax=Streptomyces sp. NPDC051662 TaxID=3154750 RepID=UPI00342F45DD